MERFSGRVGLVLAALGMAIGTGNIWRFPRVVAENGGGTFLIPWVIFLFTWSIPILIAEFAFGRESRRGPIGAFARELGSRASWMGAFIALVTMGIATYYSVVTGWTLRYLVEAIQEMSRGSFEAMTLDPSTVQANAEAAKNSFNGFVADRSSPVPQPVMYHLISVAAVAGIVVAGVKWGIELVCKLLIPLLFLMLLGGAIWVATKMGGSGGGYDYLFHVEWERLGDAKIWVAALSQSAWSTGAGWGLILAYGAYARWDEDAVGINLTAGLGNNSASLLAALFIFPALFSLLGTAGVPADQIQGVLGDSGPATTGLSFVYMPFIFKSIPQIGGWLTVAFFGGLFLAAMSSLIAMYELGTRTLSDFGLKRAPAVLLMALLGAGVGVLSALDMDFFTTIDWITSLGLIVGGLLVAWGVQLYGTNPFRERINETGARIRLGPLFNWAFVFLLPLQGIGVLAWYFRDMVTDPAWYGAGKDPWDPFVTGTYGAGPFVFWGLWILVPLVLFAPWIGRWALRGSERHGPSEPKARLIWRLFLLPVPYLLTVPALRSWFLPLWDEHAAGAIPDLMAKIPEQHRWIPIASLVGGVLLLGFLVMLFRTGGSSEAEAAAPPKKKRKQKQKPKRRPAKARREPRPRPEPAEETRPLGDDDLPLADVSDRDLR